MKNTLVTGGAGFTLVELLVVIAIIGILSAVSVVSFNTVKNKARNNAMLQLMKSVQPLIEICVSSEEIICSDCDVNKAGDIFFPVANDNLCVEETWPEPIPPWSWGAFSYSLDAKNYYLASNGNGISIICDNMTGVSRCVPNGF